MDNVGSCKNDDDSTLSLVQLVHMMRTMQHSKFSQIQKCMKIQVFVVLTISNLQGCARLQFHSEWDFLPHSLLKRSHRMFTTLWVASMLFLSSKCSNALRCGHTAMWCDGVAELQRHRREHLDRRHQAPAAFRRSRPSNSTASPKLDNTTPS